MGAEQSNEAQEKDSGPSTRKVKGTKRRKKSEKKALKRVQSKRAPTKAKTQRKAQDFEDVKKADDFITEFMNPANEREREVIKRAMRLIIMRFRERKAERLQFEEDSRRLQQFWPRLQEGIRVNKQPRNLSSPVRRLLWVDQSGWRICITKGKTFGDRTEKGLFLLDVSALWIGGRSFVFKSTGMVNYDDSQCLSLVGSERTIDLVFDSSFERDKMDEDLSAVIRVLKRRAETQGLGQFSQSVDIPLTMGDVVYAIQLKNELTAGVNVVEHVGGSRYSSTMYLEQGRVCIVRSGRPMVRGWTEGDGRNVPHGADMRDIVEVRPGMYSCSFAEQVSRQGTKAYVLDAKCCSLIASEGTINIEMETKAKRDSLVGRFSVFIKQVQSSDASVVDKMLA